MPKGEGQQGRRRGRYQLRWSLTAAEIELCTRLRSHLEREIMSRATTARPGSGGALLEAEADRLAFRLTMLRQGAMRQFHKAAAGRLPSRDDRDLAEGLRSDVAGMAAGLGIDVEPLLELAETWPDAEPPARPARRKP